MIRIRRQAGLTLVELMVATTLSLVLLAGVLVVFSANKATYQLQNGLGALQENGRYAVRQIAADLQQAGYGGCLSPHLVVREDGPPRIINTVDSPNSYLTEFADGIFLVGVDNPAGTTQIGGIDRVPLTDSIEIRGPLRSNINRVDGRQVVGAPLVIKGAASGFAQNEFLMISDCSSVSIFQAGTVTAGSDTTTINTKPLAQYYDGDALVMEFTTHTYFIGDTGRTNASGQAIRALYRFDDTNAVELVDGVEDMQIVYALDTDRDGEIEQFVSAGAGVDLSQAVAVRISLLLNSIDGASAVAAPYTYFPAGSTQVTPTAGDYLLRQEFSSVVSVRNAVL